MGDEGFYIIFIVFVVEGGEETRDLILVTLREGGGDGASLRGEGMAARGMRRGGERQGIFYYFYIIRLC